MTKAHDWLRKLLDRAPLLCSGMFSDALDELGRRDQVLALPCFNHPDRSFLGPARTVLIEARETPDENIRLGLGFLAECGAGEVLVVEGSDRFAYFGELMTAIAERRGLAGVVIDGLTRDLPATRKAGLPILATGYSPRDIKGRGRVRSVDEEIRPQGVTVRSGDLVYADADGAVVVPQEILEQVAVKVLEAVEQERDIKRLIAEGAPVAAILEKHDSF